VNGHVFDELPLLLTGEADRATVAAVTVHLRECDDCRDELIAALAGHAALMSAAKYAPGLISVAPASPGITDPAGPPTPPARADLSAVFAEVRAEVDRGTHSRSGRSRPPRRRVWLAAAAAVVIVGAGGGAYLAQSGGNSTPTRSLALAAYGQGTRPASAQLIGDDKMNLDASSLPSLAAGSYYEVWLTNATRTAMAPVGILNSDRKASITVPASEMAGYAAVEVSVQKTAGVGSYSGQSVLRGSYA
jgi:Anti-sigma-K factor rskA